MIKNLLLYAGVGKENILKVHLKIRESNRKSVALFSGLAAILTLAMTLLSFVIPELEGSRVMYLICMAVSLVLFWIVMGPAKRNTAYTILAVHAFSFTVLGIGIALGTYIEPQQASVSYCVLMFAIPLLFTSVPLIINMMTIAGIIVYTIAAYVTQDTEMFRFNMSAVIPYGVINLFITTFLMKMKISAFVLQDKTSILEEMTALNGQLRQAREEAEVASNAKTSFLFNMSHDIRTPMNAIMGFRELLDKHQEDPGRRADYLKKIDDSCHILLSIINNVLEMARIEKGTLKIEEKEANATEFWSALYTVFEDMMREKGLTFSQKFDIQHKYVYCDPTKLREIFLNILSNAYKYTPSGSVTMELKELPYDREGWTLYQTKITDTGMGMSEDFLPHVFDEFARESNTTEAKIEGTGLGMPIVKRLVEMLNGTIEVESKKGVGTTFIVTLPQRIAEKANPMGSIEKEPEQITFEGKRILMAEDNELNAEIAMEILGEAGFIVEHASDGVQCVEMLKNAPTNYYDVILMDIQMPNMNGYEATRAIRMMQGTAKSRIPILAITANAFEEDRREALRSGMDGHIAKPINIEELMNELARVLS